LITRTDIQTEETSERGWALISVLWVTTALALLAAATTALTENAYRFERRAFERAAVDAALDAGVVRAVLGIEAPDIADRWRVDGVPQRFDFGGLTLNISVQDELGRFDMNAVDDSILRALFKSQGIPEDQAETLSDRILDWRSQNSAELHRLHGATDADYAAASLPYRSRHGPFQSVDELQMVLGMTPEIFARIRPALTVYTQKAMIDPVHGTKESLLALYGGDEGAVDNIIAARTAATAVADPNISTAGRAFSITVYTQANNRSFERYAVVLLTGDPERPTITLAWK
jgi:general secretion pathway protein K